MFLYKTYKKKFKLKKYFTHDLEYKILSYFYSDFRSKVPFRIILLDA